MTQWPILVGLAGLAVGRKYIVSGFINSLTGLVKSKKWAIWIYATVTLPGVLAHEMAHFLTAALLGLKTGEIEILPQLSDSGTIEFGSVQVEKADPFRLFIVGLAPLLAGIPLVMWLWTTSNLGIGLKSYLIVCLTIHLLPSKKDLAYWPVSLLLLGLIGLITLMVKIVQ